MKAFILVAVPGPFNNGLTYIAPDNIAPSILHGRRVLVPLGTRKLVGVVISAIENPGLDPAKLKQIIEIIDDQCLFSKDLMNLLQWVSAYYHADVGDVMQTAMPKFLNRGDKLQLELPAPNDEAVKPKFKLEQPLKLTKDQQYAVDYLKLHHDKFIVSLLEGVTGSGKTEVYLQTAQTIINNGEQVLILVPEIGLTPQILARFERRFSETVLAYHSNLTNKERLKVWQAVYTGEAKIVIGTRSAVFLPFKSLGMIVIDEEHDLSFKQQSGIRYCAREVAIKRASVENIPIVLGSATPSFETLHNVELKRFSHLLLPDRAGGAVNNKKFVVDMRKQAIHAGIAHAMLEAIGKHLDAGQQVLLFLNRRGFAPVLLCHACGWVAKHQSCERHFTLHNKQNKLSCHHCEVHIRIPQQCPNCAATELIPVGTGTERLEDFLTQRFPEKYILRIDRDTTKRKGDMAQHLADINTGKADILLGTQMLAKGHHFPNVTMVGIIDIDNALFSQDFRALERMGQLIVQVSGRAGRGAKAGEVYLQTHQPEHPALQLLLTKSYHEFAKRQLVDRKIAYWPPFSFLATCFVETKIAGKAQGVLSQAVQILNAWEPGKVVALGPVPAILAKKAGWQRELIVLQATSRKDLHIALDMLKNWLRQQKLTRSIRWYIDVDPQEF